MIDFSFCAQLFLCFLCWFYLLLHLTSVLLINPFSSKMFTLQDLWHSHTGFPIILLFVLESLSFTLSCTDVQQVYTIFFDSSLTPAILLHMDAWPTWPDAYDMYSSVSVLSPGQPLNTQPASGCKMALGRYKVYPLILCMSQFFVKQRMLLCLHPCWSTIVCFCMLDILHWRLPKLSTLLKPDVSVDN